MLSAHVRLPFLLLQPRLSTDTADAMGVIRWPLTGNFDVYAESAITGYTPLTAQAAATYVQANAGLGIVN